MVSGICKWNRLAVPSPCSSGTILFKEKYKTLESGGGFQRERGKRMTFVQASSPLSLLATLHSPPVGQNRFGTHFGVDAPPSLVYSGDWEKNWPMAP